MEMTVISGLSGGMSSSFRSIPKYLFQQT